MAFGFAPELAATPEDELRVFLFERRREFMKPSALVAGEFVILEDVLDRLVCEFLRGLNRLN